MALFTIEIPDETVDRAFDAIAEHYHYKPRIWVFQDIDGVSTEVEIDNPESKKDFFHRILTQFVKENVVAYEVSIGSKQASEVAKDKADSEIEVIIQK